MCVRVCARENKISNFSIKTKRTATVRLAQLPDKNNHPPRGRCRAREGVGTRPLYGLVLFYRFRFWGAKFKKKYTITNVQKSSNRSATPRILCRRYISHLVGRLGLVSIRSGHLRCSPPPTPLLYLRNIVFIRHIRHCRHYDR